MLDIVPSEPSKAEASAEASAEADIAFTTGKSCSGEGDITSFDHDNWKEFLAAKHKGSTK